MTDTNAQPGACAPVPLPEPFGYIYADANQRSGFAFTRDPISKAGAAMYGQGEVYSVARLRVYGEACAAREAAKYQAAVASATATMMDGTQALMQLGRERDIWKERAEAAEVAHARYEAVRKMSAADFTKIYRAVVSEDKKFDTLVDEFRRKCE